MHRVLILGLIAMSFVGCRPNDVAAPAEPQPQSHSQFVYVRIPEQILPLDRGEKYEDPLDAVLRKEQVGEVSGGGTQLSATGADGKQSIEFAGIDVDLTDLDKGLPILKRELIRLGAPADTVLEYTRDGKSVEDRLR